MFERMKAGHRVVLPDWLWVKLKRDPSFSHCRKQASEIVSSKSQDTYSFMTPNSKILTCPGARARAGIKRTRASVPQDAVPKEIPSESVEREQSIPSSHNSRPDQNLQRPPRPPLISSKPSQRKGHHRETPDPRIQSCATHSPSSTSNTKRQLPLPSAAPAADKVPGNASKASVHRSGTTGMMMRCRKTLLGHRAQY